MAICGCTYIQKHIHICIYMNIYIYIYECVYSTYIHIYIYIKVCGSQLLITHLYRIVCVHVCLFVFVVFYEVRCCQKRVSGRALIALSLARSHLHFYFLQANGSSRHNIGPTKLIAGLAIL